MRLKSKDRYPMVLDEIDKEILRLLRQNSRIPVSHISREIGLSSPSIRDRIKKLEESGIIRGYSLLVDHKKLGLGITAFVGLTLNHSQCCREDVVEALRKLPQVVEGYYTDGEEDMLLKLITEDTAMLMETMVQITSIDGINRTRTVIALSTPIAN